MLKEATINTKVFKKQNQTKMWKVQKYFNYFQKILKMLMTAPFIFNRNNHFKTAKHRKMY